MAEKHWISQIQTWNHEYTLQNQCTHPNDTYRHAYILNKWKLGAYTWLCTPNQGFHPIRTTRHSPRSPRTHIHDHNISVVNSNTDTHARGANDKCPLQVKPPLTRLNAGMNPITSPQSNTSHRTTLFFSYPSHPRLVLHTFTWSRAWTVILPIITSFYQLTHHTSRRTHRPAQGSPIAQ